MAFPLRKVLISDEVDPKCVTILQNNGINVEKNTKLSKEELLAKIPVSSLTVHFRDKCKLKKITRMSSHSPVLTDADAGAAVFINQ